MAKNKKNVDDYRSLDDQALMDKLNEETLRLKKLKFAHAINPIENPAAISATRKYIAKLKTEQHQRKTAQTN